jgi:hypothetical protein
MNYAGSSICCVVFDDAQRGFTNTPLIVCKSFIFEQLLAQDLALAVVACSLQGVSLEDGEFGFRGVLTARSHAKRLQSAAKLAGPYER